MDIWDILFVLSLVFLGFLSVKNVVRFIRKFAAGKKVGIIKIVAGWGVIISELMGVALIIVAVNRLSVARGYREKAAEYQQVLDTFDSVMNGSDKVQHLSSTLPESRATVERAISNLTVAAKLSGISGWYALVFGIHELTLGIASIVLITEAGIVWSNIELPEPFTAVYRNGNIEVDIKADLANKKGVRTFKGTPENLAKFGRFIEWETPEEQTAPPNNNNLVT